MSLEAKGDGPAPAEEALDEFLDLLADHGAAVSSSTLGDRYGATFTVEEAVDNAAAAVALGYEVFITFAEKSGLPLWPVVRAEALTLDEQDRELADPTVPELVGVSEIAQTLGVTRQRASALTRSAGFPVPITTLASGPVWTRQSLNHFVVDWRRKGGRPPKLATLVRSLLRSINDHPSVALVPETHEVLHTSDEVIAREPYAVCVRLAQALDAELLRFRTIGRAASEIEVVQSWLDETLRTMSGYSAASK